MTKSTKLALVVFAVVLAFAFGTMLPERSRQSEAAADPDGHWDHLGSNVFTAGGTSRVGIQTASPARALHVSDSGTLPMLVDGSSPLGSGLEFAVNGERTFLIGTRSIVSGVGTDYSTQFFTDRPDLGFHISTGGSPISRFMVSNTGNVGIGTTDPGKRLHVFDSVTLPMRVDGSNETGAGIEFAQDGTRTFVIGTRSQVTGVGTDYSPQVFADRTSDGFHVSTGGSPVSRLMVSNTGNVGIGTTSPGEKLQVEGNIKLNGNITSDGEICIGSGC